MCTEHGIIYHFGYTDSMVFQAIESKKSKIESNQKLYRTPSIAPKLHKMIFVESYTLIIRLVRSFVHIGHTNTKHISRRTVSLINKAKIAKIVFSNVHTKLFE